jgi:uroporphyrinogen decarboxylase
MIDMNARERLLLTLNHQEPDRVPIDLGGTDISSICRGAYKELMAWLGRNPGEIEMVNLVEQLPALDEEFLDEVIRSDVRQVRQNAPSSWSLQIEETDRYYEFEDEFGIRLRKPKEDGYYFDLVGHPLRELTKDSLKTFSWPDLDDPSRWEGVEDRARNLHETTEHGLVVGAIFGGGVFEFPQYLRGMEAFLMDLVLTPDLADSLMDCITEFLSEAYTQMLQRVGPYIQVIMICDDIATQQGPMISPDLYRARIKPRQAKLIEVIKRHTDAYVMYHACGATKEFLPDFIDIGVDIFNPVQVGAVGMDDTATLKREFGRDLTFWGGACENQVILPFGTPDEVREETRRRIDDLAPGGGFVFSPVHNIQDGVPPENILAMFEVAHEYGVY